MTTSRTQAITDMAIATVFFAGMSFCVKWAKPLPTAEIVFFRALIALVLCLIHLRLLGIAPLGTHRKLLFLRGFFGSCALISFFWSIGHLPLATASVLQSLSPIFTAILGVALLGERFRKAQLALFCVAIAGVVVMQGTGSGGAAGDITVAVAGAALSACAYTVIAKIGKREHPLVIVLWFPLVTVPLISPILYSVWVWPTPQQWAALFGIGICVQIAQVFMTRSFQTGPTSVVSLVTYLGLVWAGLGGALLFDEPVTFGLLVGAVLIVIAVIGTSRLRGVAPAAVKSDS
ncbi:MAG: drug/metabolite transporter (DMT)-like permease [Myxococcota bacterium]